MRCMCSADADAASAARVTHARTTHAHIQCEMPASGDTPTHARAVHFSLIPPGFLLALHAQLIRFERTPRFTSQSHANGSDGVRWSRTCSADHRTGGMRNDWLTCSGAGYTDWPRRHLSQLVMCLFARPNSARTHTRAYVPCTCA